MSYKNPQKVVSKAFDVSLGLLKAETQDLYRREAEDRKQQRRFGEMATQALMNKKAQQRSFDQAQRKQEQDLYNRVASLQVGSTKACAFSDLLSNIILPSASLTASSLSMFLNLPNSSDSTS